MISARILALSIATASLSLPAQAFEPELKAAAISALRLASVLPDGTKANGHTGIYRNIDANRFVIWSQAKNYPHPVSSGDQLYIKNMKTGSLVVLSRNAQGVAANGWSQLPSFAADRNIISYTTSATNLFPGDTNNQPDIVVKNLKTEKVIVATRTASGVLSNGWSESSALSSDATRVYYASGATNLVTGDTNKFWDIFEKNLVTGKIRRISVTAAGKQLNEGSYSVLVPADGKSVIFGTYATNIVAADTSNDYDFFRKDLATGKLTQLSLTATGKQIDGGAYPIALSTDGTQLLIESYAKNLPGNPSGKSMIYIKNLTTGKIRLVSRTLAGIPANGDCFSASFSPDGTKVLFMSNAKNLTGRTGTDIYDVFVKDLVTEKLVRVSTSVAGVPQNFGAAHKPYFSLDGKLVMFESQATNLLPADKDNNLDAYIATLK